LSRVPSATTPFLSVRGRLGRVVATLSARGVPRLARRAYALELTSTFFFSITLAAIEGGVVAVLARQTFAGVVPERPLNLAVGLLGSMEALANILSFFWSAAGQGRAKIALINVLQVATIAAIAATSVLPRTPAGLWMLVGVVLIARVCWSGILTIRPTVWRANYARDVRAGIVGRFSIVQMLIVAAVASLLGWALDRHAGSYAVAVPAACVLGVGAVLFTSRIRVRGQRRLLRREREGAPPMRPWHGPLIVWRVLRKDVRYAQFMLCMFVLGVGNMMMVAVLVPTLKERFDEGYLGSILITTVIPSIVMALAIPAWARFLDRAHVVRFRAIQSWAFVISGGAFLLAVALGDIRLMFVGAVSQGIALGGGTLAWNLGHVDFAPPSETSQYMATHVTLNGVRGLIAPILSIALYESFKHAGMDADTWIFAISLLFSTAGGVGFVSLYLSMGQAARVVGRAA